MKKTLAALALVVALGLIGWSVVTEGDKNDPANGSTVPIGSVDLDQNETTTPKSRTADIVEEVLDSVVNVRVTAVSSDPFGDVQQGRGEGSAVVISRDGVIVTNFHVVAGAVDVEVVLQDGRKLEGRVVGGVADKDLAVIKVDADDLAPIELGSSDDMRLGDDVIAVGYPLDLGGVTVTKGILSATDRTINPEGAEAPLTDMLQTDAAINPGNSGGALVDAAGRLIGINSAAAGAGTAENVGFAIPIDSAIPVIREIIEDPPEEHAWMGVSTADLTPVTAAQLGLSIDEGALITFVYDGTPAADAGLEQGDVVTAVDGEGIASSTELVEALGDKDPGDEVALAVESEDGERTVTVTLEQRPAVFDS
jgi:putative serine protease PepD